MTPFFRLNSVTRAIVPVAGALSCFAAIPVFSATYQVVDPGAAPGNVIHSFVTDQSTTNDRVIGYGYNRNQFYDDDDDDYDSDDAGDDNKNSDGTNNDEDSNLGNDDADDHDFATLDDLEDIEFFANTLISDGGAGWQIVRIFDQVDSGTGEYSSTTNDYLFDINSAGLAVGYGSAPYHGIYVDADHPDDGDEYDRYVRDFASRAFVYTPTNQVVPLMAPESDHGGVGGAYSINEANWIVGYASTYLLDDSREWIEDCLEDGDRNSDFCESSPVYQIQAYAWQVDDQGNVVAQKALPLGVGELPDSEREDTVYRAGAYDINENNIAVGYSYVFRDEGDDDYDKLDSQAVIWDVDNDTVSDFIHRDSDDDLDYYRSFAISVNENNMVVGNGYRYINGYSRIKGFYYQYTNADTIGEVHELPTPLKTSSLRANYINNNNQIVGQYDYETSSAQLNRRMHGFLYRVGDDEITDLNDFLPCDSAYEIVRATRIDDNGVIEATALYNIDPSTEDEDNWVSRGVLLEPIAGGTIEQCPETPTDDNIDSDRSGAAFPWVLLPLLGWLGWRRRR